MLQAAAAVLGLDGDTVEAMTPVRVRKRFLELSVLTHPDKNEHIKAEEVTTLRFTWAIKLSRQRLALLPSVT